MIIGIILAVIAVFLFVVGAAAWLGKLPGNSYFGLKVPEVRKSEEIWRAAHQVAGPLWVVAGASFAIGSLVAFRAQGWGWLWLIVALAVIAGLVLFSMGNNFGARAAALLDEELSEEEEGGCSSGGCDCCGDDAAEPEAATPDLTALRKAAANQDN